MKYKVLIFKKEDFSYNIDILCKWLKEGFNFIWGEDYFSKKSKVLIKPNLLMKAQVSSAITTHPNFIISLARVLKEKNLSVFVADNPGGFGSNQSIEEIYQVLGLNRHPELFTLLYNNKPPYRQGEFSFSWWSKDFEIINLPKLKTHDLLGITAAVKNLYGLIPGLLKTNFHKRYPKSYEFAKLILKIYKWFEPKINILDGIVSLEGEGPAKGGVPKERGLIIFSNSSLALDYTLAKLIGSLPERFPHLRIALEEGMIKEELIETYPPGWEKFKIRDFVFSLPTFIENIPKPLLKLSGKTIRFFPFIDNSKCKRCAQCVSICPTQAITLLQGKINLNPKKCIGCMCCVEVCSWAAIKVKESFFLKGAKKLYKMVNSFGLQFGH